MRIGVVVASTSSMASPDGSTHAWWMLVPKVSAMPRRDGVEDSIQGHHHAKWIRHHRHRVLRCATGRQTAVLSLSPTLYLGGANDPCAVRPPVSVRPGRCGLQLRVGPQQLLAQGCMQTAW